MPRAVALFSGGLDSMLAICVLQAQGFDVEALNIRTIYSCCQATAAQSASALGARLTVVPVGDDYLEVVRNPLYGYGKGVNPCIDCRIYMCRMAKRFMEEMGACVVVTGEIAGQRPMSQNKHQLDIIARRSGLDGRLLRPLSAKLLPPTVVELEGIVDREQLYDFNGRGRRRLIELADALGIRKSGIAELPPPSTGCALTEPTFATRVRDLMQFHPGAMRWDFELLNHGRHFRFNAQTKVVLGRSGEDNTALRGMAARRHAPETALLMPENFRGPDALVVGSAGSPAWEFAGAWMLRYGGRADASQPRVRLSQAGQLRVISVRADESARTAKTL